MRPRVYRTWRLSCDTCRVSFPFAGWDTEVPTICECGGVFDGGPTAQPKRTFNKITDANIILQDLADTRWPEHLGG